MADLTDLKARVAAAPEAFYGRFVGLRKAGNNWVACCPFHTETEPSFTIYPDGHHHCYGCQVNGDAVDFIQKRESLDTVAAIARVEDLLGATPTSPQRRSQRPATSPQEQPKPDRKPDRTYDIMDAAGVLVAQHHRFDPPTPGGRKTFTWSRPGHNGGGLAGLPVDTLPLYCLWLLQGSVATNIVFVTEGEKACESLAGTGLVVVGTYGGSTIPRPAVLEPLRGRRVILWPDNDVPGYKHMHELGQRLRPIAASVKTLHWADAPPKGDAADFLALGGTKEQVISMAEQAAVVAKSDPDPTVPLLPIANVRTMMEQVGKVQWLWQDWIPRGAITLLVGDPGIGKSTVALYLAGCVTQGLPWPDGAPSVTGENWAPGRVLINECEAGQVAMGERLSNWGFDLSLIDVLGEDGTESFMLDQHGLIPSVRATVQHYGHRLIIVDSLSGAKGTKTKEIDSEMGNIIKPWAEMARDLGIVLLIVHHLNKGDGEREVSLRRVRGSSAISALPRSIIGVDKPDAGDERLRLLPIKANYAALAPAVGFRLGGSAPDWCDAPRGPHTETRTDLAEEFLETQLAAGPKSHEVLLRLASAAGFNTGRVYAAKRRAGIVVVRDPDDPYGRQTLWALPTGNRKG